MKKKNDRTARTLSKLTKMLEDGEMVDMLGNGRQRVLELQRATVRGEIKIDNFTPKEQVKVLSKLRKIANKAAEF